MTRPKEIDGVDIAQLERVFKLLRERLPDVFMANRYFEEKTGFHNEAGTNNIVDALSHFATLIEKAEELGSEGQAEQVAHLEDHLRRSMMEAFEQTLKFALSDASELWDAYLERVNPMLSAGRDVPGAVPLSDLMDMRQRIAQLLEIGRQSKRGVSWEDWEEGTGALAEACDIAEELCEALNTSIRSAEYVRRGMVRARLTAVGVLLFLAVGFLIGHLLA
jgi:hypothetical protein